MMRWKGFSCAAAALVLMAAPVSAQTISLLPKVGGFAPLSDLQDANGGVQELKGSLAIGLAAELKLPVLPRLRVGFDYATNSELSDSGIGATGTAPNATLLAVTGDLVLRPLNAGPIRPYGLLGAGVKHYDISTDELTDPDLQAIFDHNQSNFTGHLGAGLDVGLGVLGVTVEASDYISRFDPGDAGDSKWQNDIFAMVGMRLGLF